MYISAKGYPFYGRFDFFSHCLRESGCLSCFPLKFRTGNWHAASQTDLSFCACPTFDRCVFDSWHKGDDTQCHFIVLFINIGFLFILLHWLSSRGTKISLVWFPFQNSSVRIVWAISVCLQLFWSAERLRSIGHLTIMYLAFYLDWGWVNLVAMKTSIYLAW